MKKQDFISGVKDGIPICLGYFSVSMAFGMTGVLSGVPIWTVVLISLTNLTSAGQFAGLNLLIAQGSMMELALTTLIINIRYFLMSLSVSQKVSPKMGTGKRLLISFGITDEIFAVSVGKQGTLSASYMIGLILTPLLGWTGGTLTGAIATSFMPEKLSAAMGIALYGMFIAIVVPVAKKEKNVLFAVILAILCSLAFHYLPGCNRISSGWSIIIIALVVCGIAAWLFPIETDTREGA